MSNISKSSELMSSAHFCLDSDKRKEAAALFSQVCELEPGNAEAWLMLGAISDETGGICSHYKKA